MIDIHCHLLPGIDDGPNDMAAALALARQAVENGVTHSIVTPHIHQGRWENNISTISSVVSQFKQALSDECIPLTIGMAGEVRIGFELLDMVQKDQVPFLGSWEGREVMLLEMPHSHIPLGADKIVGWLLKHGVLPMIAHPERNKDVMRKLEKLTPLIELGCLFQVTSGAVCGRFGSLAQERSHQLLEMGVVTVLASDAHHVGRRPVNLAQGCEAAVSIVGDKEARRLVYDTPLSIVSRQFDEALSS